MSYAVVADVLANLSLPSFGNVDTVETKIVYRLRAMGVVDDELQDDSVVSIWTRLLNRLCIKHRSLFVLKINSISSLFICESVEELRLLREHYKSGLIKEVLQELFTVLADEPVEISRLEWTEDQYVSCVHQFGMFYVIQKVLLLSYMLVMRYHSRLLC